jgi:NADH-quinone oxidoreductase subunit C
MRQLTEMVRAALGRWMGQEVPVTWRRDVKGVATGWCRLSGAHELLPVARALADLNGRLGMITASLGGAPQREKERELSYHFDLDGATLTVTLELPLKGAQVPSLTPVFRNADWSEREVRELYRIEVTGHPDPRPLFLDPSLGRAAFERLIPYSTFSNGASGTRLWEMVLKQNPGGGHS